jgi:hypothetical protein
MLLKTVRPQPVENDAVSKRSYLEFDWQSDQFRTGALFSIHKLTKAVSACRLKNIVAVEDDGLKWVQHDSPGIFLPF